MPNQVDLRKDVFAWFGAAAYAAQCFEQESCILLLSIHRLQNPNSNLDELNKEDLKLSKKVLGKLIHEIANRIQISCEVQKVFNKCLDQRNYLADHFFAHHATSLLSEDGCNRMIAELQDISDNLKTADELAQAYSREIRELLGISEDDLKKSASAYIAEFTDNE